MDISVVIVNYNVRYFLEQCILSVQAASLNLNVEIIVVDNNSSDDSCILLKGKFPGVQLIENQENVGFSKANNQGVEIASGDFVLILNPDTVIAEDTLDKVFNFANCRKDIGVLGVKLIDGSGKFLPESKRNIPSPFTSFNKLFRTSKKEQNNYYALHLNEDESGEVEILVGAFMFLKKSVYNEVNGFDTDYFMYGEDIDLSYKVLKKGCENYYFTDTQIIHYKGESTKRDIQNLKHFQSAMKIFYKKHFKQSVFYNFIVKVGIEIWFLMNIFKLKAVKNNPRIVSRILYVGGDEILYNFLINKYENVISIKSENISTLNEIVPSKKVDCVILDNTFMTFKEVITAVHSLKNECISIKIRPKQSSFLVSSTSSKINGEIDKF